MNVWCGQGNVGQDPKVGSTKSGIKYARLSLAVSERYQDASGTWKDNTVWIECVAWRQKADLIASHVRKGSRLAIVGRITTNEYQTASGEKRKGFDVEIREMELLNRVATTEPGAAPAGARVEDDTEDLPF